MTHIFQDFLVEPLEINHLVLEKDTKKEVKTFIDQLEVLVKEDNRKYRKFSLFQVDASVINKEESIAQLTAYSMYLWRNFGSGSSLQMVELFLNEGLLKKKVTSEEEEVYFKLKRRGGSWEDYLKLEGIDWFSVNTCMTLEINKVIKSMDEARTKYKEVISQVSSERIPLHLERQFNFQRVSTNLMELHRRCFDEVGKILHPTHQYNPSPSFQRDLVWSTEKKEKFIISIIKDLPIGSFYVNVGETYDQRNELGEGYGGLVWDGKQRLHALESFLRGEFEIRLESKWVSYFDNTAYFNIKFSSCNISIFESRFDTLREVIEAYVIINQAQVKHTDEDLEKAIKILHETTGELV